MVMVGRALWGCIRSSPAPAVTPTAGCPAPHLGTSRGLRGDPTALGSLSVTCTAQKFSKGTSCVLICDHGLLSNATAQSLSLSSAPSLHALIGTNGIPQSPLFSRLSVPALYSSSQERYFRPFIILVALCQALYGMSMAVQFLFPNFQNWNSGHNFYHK